MKSDVLKKLAVTVSSHANDLCDRMRELGVKRLITHSGTLEKRYHQSNQGSYSTLSWEDSSGDLTLGKVAIDGDEGTYVYGDFNSWIAAPTPSDLLRYAEGLAGINRTLGVVSDQRNSRITAAISAFVD